MQIGLESRINLDRPAHIEECRDINAASQADGTPSSQALLQTAGRTDTDTIAWQVVELAHDGLAYVLDQFPVLEKARLQGARKLRHKGPGPEFVRPRLNGTSDER